MLTWDAGRRARECVQEDVNYTPWSATSRKLRLRARDACISRPWAKVRVPPNALDGKSPDDSEAGGRRVGGSGH